MLHVSTFIYTITFIKKKSTFIYINCVNGQSLQHYHLYTVKVNERVHILFGRGVWKPFSKKI